VRPIDHKAAAVSGARVQRRASWTLRSERINEHLARWFMHKFKRFCGNYAKAMA
jgi:hypothetical protein